MFANVSSKLGRIAPSSRKGKPKRARALLFDVMEERVVMSTVVVTPGTGSYPTIQSAVNASNNGDTITIPSGTYAESVTLNKALTINITGGNTTATINGLTESLPQYTTQTLNGTFSVTGDLNVGNSGQVYATLNSGEIDVAGNINATNTTIAGSTVIAAVGSANQTLTGTATGVPGLLTNLVVNKTGYGTLSLVGNIGVDGNSGFTQTAGAVNAGTSTFYFLPGQYLTQTDNVPNVAFNNLIVQSGAYGTVSMASNLTVNGSFSEISTATNGPVMFNAPPSMTVGGNFTVTGTTSGPSTTTTPVFTAGTGTVTFVGANQTINAPTVAFNNVTLALNQYTPLNVTGTINVGGNLAIGGGVYTSLASGTIAVAGNVSSTNPKFSGAGTILINGVNNQTLSGITPQGTPTGGVSSIMISKPSGVLNMVGDIGESNNWTYVDNGAHGADVYSGQSTVRFFTPQYASQTVNSGLMKFDNISLEGGTYSTLNVVGTMLVFNDVYLTYAGDYTGLNSNGYISYGGILRDPNNDTTFRNKGNIQHS